MKNLNIKNNAKHGIKIMSNHHSKVKLKSFLLWKPTQSVCMYPCFIYGREVSEMIEKSFTIVYIGRVSLCLK